jgi:predicted ATPase/DNA-binding SARP family transcriptional activator
MCFWVQRDSIGATSRVQELTAEERNCATMEARWQITLLGGLRAEGARRTLSQFRSQKTGFLLAYLAYFLQRTHPRDALVELFWPDADFPAARGSLSVSLTFLRQHLEPVGSPPGSVLITDRTSVRLSPDAVTTDVAAFEAALQAAGHAPSPHQQLRSLVEAVAHYRGELLPGCFEEWALLERERLAEAHLHALGRIIHLLEGEGDYPRALDYARRAVAADPFREEGHQELMRLLGAAGQPEAALRHFGELERLLRQELDETPTAATLALVDSLRPHARSPGAQSLRLDEELLSSRPACTRHPAPQLPAGIEDGAEPRGPCASGHLPLPLTRFFGRERERALLEKLLASDARLVTLMGLAGSGKTRLALEVAHRLVEGWRGAVWFVPLADLSEAGRIPDAIRQAMLLSPSTGEELLEQVARALSAQPSLLLLDNFEHLLPVGARLIRTLLERAPSLTCLVTSRRRLDLSGERVFFLPPLPVPKPTHDNEFRPTTSGLLPSLVVGRNSLSWVEADVPTPEELMQIPSVQLFVDRAQASRADFVLTEANTRAVAAVCRQLEGLPLAIELAAARAGVLTPEQMLVQLERGLGVLASRSEETAVRHRSLRAAVEWSYQMLAPALQRFFTSLSAFRGGCNLEAAEAVSGDPLALDHLEELRECSLVLAEETSAPSSIGEERPGFAEMRYRLLETLREYGREQMGEEERAELARRHAEYFVTWAEQVREELRQTHDEQTFGERLEIEHDNVRAAMVWAVERKEAESGLRLTRAMGAFWEVRGYLSEGRERLAAVLALTDSSDLREGMSDSMRSARAWALRNAGALAWRQGDYGPAHSLLDESIAIQRALGDRLGVASALHILGAVVFNQGDLATSRTVGEEALAIAGEIESTDHIAIALHNLAYVTLVQGDCETARPLYVESLSLSRELGHQYNAAYSLHGLGMIDHRRGDWGSARAFHDECLTLRRELGDRLGIGMTLESLGLLARDQGEFGTAQACLEESLALRRELGDRRGIAGSLDYLGMIASDQGDAERAQCLLEESLAMAREQGDREIAAAALHNLGVLMARRGDAPQARALVEESLAIFREAGVGRAIGQALCTLGGVAADEGDADAAGALLRESLMTLRHLGDRYGIARALEGLARVAGLRGEAHRAARLYGAASGLREELGAPVPPADRAAYKRRIDDVRACLGEDAFAAGWAEGRGALSEGPTAIEQVVGLAAKEVHCRDGDGSGNSGESD